MRTIQEKLNSLWIDWVKKWHDAHAAKSAALYHIIHGITFQTTHFHRKVYKHSHYYGNLWSNRIFILQTALWENGSKKVRFFASFFTHKKSDAENKKYFPNNVPYNIINAWVIFSLYLLTKTAFNEVIMDDAFRLTQKKKNGFHNFSPFCNGKIACVWFQNK